MQKVLLGLKNKLVPIPWRLFKLAVPRGVKKTKRVLGGLDDEHRLVHHFAVLELPRLGKPISPTFIAEALEMREARIIEILDELERRLIFIFRPGGRDVVWAYPLTVEQTPHRLTFSSGEKLYAA